METKKSKVVAATFKNQGTGQYGPYFIHTIVFENSDVGDYLSKKNPQDYFKVGQEAEYTKEVKQNGQYTNITIKPVQTQGTGNNFRGGGSPVAQNKRTALECAVSLAVAGKIKDNEIIPKASSFAMWLNQDQQATASATPPALRQQAAPPPQEPDYVDDDSSSLPF